MLKCRRNVPGLPVIRQDRDMEQCQNFTVTHDSRGVATVSFDMPGRRYNVLTEQAFLELEQIANHLADSPAVRCVVFSSGKDSGFVAGADLKELSALPNAECAAQLVSLGQRVFDRIEALAIPTVAVIHGPCLGGGLEFALACKYRAACDEPSTRLGTPEVKLGLMPAWGGIQRLPERVGLEAALRLLWLGRAVSARQALEMGLVDLLWPRDVFQEGVEHFVSALATQRTVEIPDTSAGWAANGDPQEIPDAGAAVSIADGTAPRCRLCLKCWNNGGKADAPPGRPRSASFSPNCCSASTAAAAWRGSSSARAFRGAGRGWRASRSARRFVARRPNSQTATRWFSCKPRCA